MDPSPPTPRRRGGGPKTPEGKARSSRNALKHGLFSSQVLLHHEDPQEFFALRDATHATLRPVGFLEELYADQVVACLWRLRRALAVEAANMDRVYTEIWATGAPDLSPDDRHRRALVALLSNRYAENIHGYASRIQAELQRANQQLSYLQLARLAGRPIPFGAARISLPSGRSPGRPRKPAEN